MHLVIYTNILTPYRKYFFDLINKQCQERGDKFHVLVMAETEPNRTWKYNQLASEYTILLKNRMFLKGEIFVHINKDLKSKLKELKPDVLVCAGSYLCPGVWKATKLKRKLNYKVLYWSESHLKESKNMGGIKKSFRSIIRKTIYHRFDGFWYAGTLSKQFCEKYASKQAKYYFVPNLIDEQKYQGQMDAIEREEIRKQYNIDLKRKVLLCPARLSPVKGIVEFLHLFKDVKNKSQATVLIAGEGELKERIEGFARENLLDVRLLGYKTQEEVAKLYQISDIFLMPSLSDPNPLTCIEAIWSGLPLLISEHCGNAPEIVIEGENGYVFSYADKEDSIKKIESIIVADSQWNALAKETSRKIAKNTYTSATMTVRILTEMEELGAKE